jgi:hypothetical protein
MLNIDTKASSSNSFKFLRVSTDLWLQLCLSSENIITFASIPTSKETRDGQEPKDMLIGTRPSADSIQ